MQKINSSSFTASVGLKFEYEISGVYIYKVCPIQTEPMRCTATQCTIRIRKSRHAQRFTMKPATDDSRDVLKMRKTCEMRETCEKKSLHKITWKLIIQASRFDYFLIQLFYPLSHEKIPLSRA